jgi:hypothetical protein
MRFAYIDSHGNEVPIPSVDALALRIELGAVGPDTQLYDAQADHWGPAKTHEIFHSLSREVDDEGFVPPPPPVAPPPAAPRPASPPPAAKAAPEIVEDAVEEDDVDDEPVRTGAAADLGLTLADPPPAPPEGEEKEEEDEVTAGGFADLDLEVAPPAPGGPAPASPKQRPAVEAGGGFDFGDLGGGLELEGAHDESDMRLESPMEFGGGLDAGGGDDLVLETPMSQYRPASPPGWAAETGGEDVMDFSTVSAETGPEEEAIVPPREAAARHRRTAKDRPSPPKFRRRHSLSGPIVFVVILLALGVGGYVGWPILSARLSEGNAPERPPVVMPAISPELLPRMHALADAAIADVVEAADAATMSPDVPTEPAQEWLAGVYLGNASRFPGIEAFWTSVEQLVDQLRAGDWERYHDALLERVEAEGLSAAEAAIVVERADSGFVAAEASRAEIYAVMERLVFAALDLHDFLIDNEESIEYQPATTSTVDPVLEAVPATQAIGDQMWDMVDEITESLDALGSLDRVTRERLVTAMRTRLQEVGVQ